MANDHYISRFLTKPWEIGQRRLHYYDFKAGVFGSRSSETLFAADGLHSEETGKLLNELIENPVSQYRAEILQGAPRDKPNNDWKLYRALVGLIWLQVARHPGVHVPEDNPFSLAGLVSQGERLLDIMGRMSVERYPLIGVALPVGSQPLFFSDAVYFPIPMVATPPILAVPLTPRHFVAVPEKDFPNEGLEQWLRDPLVLSAFSMGRGSTGQVVIPPEHLEWMETNPTGFQRMLHQQRATTRKLINLVAEGNRLVGFRSFIASDEDPEGPQE